MNTSVTAALREELKTIENRKRAIEQFLSVYENGVVAPKLVKPRAKRKSGPTFHDIIIELAKKIAGANENHVTVKQVLDAATANGIVPGKDRNKELQKIAGQLIVENRRGTFDRVEKGHYQLKNV